MSGPRKDEEHRAQPERSGESRASPKQGRVRTKRAERRRKVPSSAGRARARSERGRKVSKRDGAARGARARPPAEARRRWRVRTGSLAPSPGCPQPRQRGTPGTPATNTPRAAITAPPTAPGDTARTVTHTKPRRDSLQPPPPTASVIPSDARRDAGGLGVGISAMLPGQPSGGDPYSMAV